MTITTRAELITQVGLYLSDDTLASQTPVFIQMAESMFNRRLFILGNQGKATITAAATIALPSDFNGIDTLFFSDYAPLEQLGPDDFQTRFAEDTATAVPEVFMIADGNIYIGPPPDSAYSGTMHYWKKLPALTADNPTNWLLTAHPDLYLYATLLQAEMFGWNDARIPLFQNAVEITTAEIVRADARARRTDLVGAVPADYF